MSEQYKRCSLFGGFSGPEKDRFVCGPEKDRFCGFNTTCVQHMGHPWGSGRDVLFLQERNLALFHGG